MMAAGASLAEKAKLVRENAEKTCRLEMEGVPPEVPYTVVDLVGKGSFGCVFKGIHNESKQVYAIKSLDLDQHDEEIKDMQKEIGVLSQLKAGDAPNITAFYGSYVLGHRLWIIMDFCSGGSMRTLMKAGPIEEKFIGVVVRETLTALSYLHSQGIIHRDIKAANILVHQDGRIQLCDFGVSAQLAGKNNKRNTFVGTLQWMAPEALAGGLYDFKIDIWSFGITIYEMAKMNPPLHQYHPERVIQMIPRMPPPRLEGGAWSNALREFVALCLNEIPNQRPTAEELQKSKFVRSARQPTSIMRELILRYEAWEKSGGVRVSMLYGAGSGNDNRADTVNDPAWDFDTVKSRISGVPKEWGMMSRETTLRPQRPAMSGPRPRGAERLYRLFETPGEEEPWDDAPLDFKPQGNGSYSAVAPGSGSGSGLNVISIPSFDDNGVMVSGDPSSSPIGMITMPTMPTDEEIMEMAREKAAAAAAAAAAMRPPPPPPPPPQAPPSSTPPSTLPTETPDITRTRPQRSGSAGASVLRPMDMDPPNSPRTIVRDTSPRRAPVAASAPSSPPRSGSQQSGLAAPATNGHRAHHLPSKSVPISAREGPAPPPIPSINSPQKSATRSAESTPAPHLKSRSQDITVRQQRTPGKGPVQRPSHLNLNAPNSSNFEAAEGSKPPPSPSHAMHTPQQSLGSISVASSTSGANRPYPGAPPQQPEVGSLEFPVIAPLDAGVLGPNASHQDLMRELDRMLGGLGDALEVVEVGLKRLQTERKQKVPEDIEE